MTYCALVPSSVNKLLLRSTSDVLRFVAFECQQAVVENFPGSLRVGKIPQCEDRFPEVSSKTRVVQIAILRYDGGKVCGSGDCQTKSNRCTVVVNVHGCTASAAQPGCWYGRYVGESVCKVVRNLGQTKPWIVRSQDVVGVGKHWN